jgi:hypothetical protein
MQADRSRREIRPTAITRAVVGRGQITIRAADAADLPAIRRLAALSSRPVPAGALIVAETDQGLLAVIGEAGAFADPFSATADLVEILHLRVAQLDAA